MVPRCDNVLFWPVIKTRHRFGRDESGWVVCLHLTTRRYLPDTNTVWSVSSSVARLRLTLGMHSPSVIRPADQSITFQPERSNIVCMSRQQSDVLRLRRGSACMSYEMMMANVPCRDASFFRVGVALDKSLPYDGMSAKQSNSRERTYQLGDSSAFEV